MMPLATLKRWENFYLRQHLRLLAVSRQDPARITRVHRELSRVRRQIRFHEKAGLR